MKSTTSLYHFMLLGTITLVFSATAYIMYDLTKWQHSLSVQADARNIRQNAKQRPLPPAANAPNPIALEDNNKSWDELEPEYTGPKRFAAKGLPEGYYVQDAPEVMEMERNVTRTTQSTVHAGTQVELETTTPLNIKHITAGQTIDLRVKYDVVVGRSIVIPAGSVAKAQVNDARRKKLFKKSQLCIEPKYVQTPDGRFIPLSGRPAYFQSKDNYPLSAGATLFANIAATTEVESRIEL